LSEHKIRLMSSVDGLFCFQTIDAWLVLDHNHSGTYNMHRLFQYQQLIACQLFSSCWDISNPYWYFVLA